MSFLANSMNDEGLLVSHYFADLDLWDASACYDEEYKNTEWVNVYFFIVIIIFVDDSWRHELLASNATRHCMFLNSHQFGDTEVTNLDCSVAGNEDARRLQVTMDDSLGVDKLHCFCNLVYVLDNLFVGNYLVFNRLLQVLWTKFKKNARWIFFSLLKKMPYAFIMFTWSSMFMISYSPTNYWKFFVFAFCMFISLNAYSSFLTTSKTFPQRSSIFWKFWFHLR